MSKIDFNTCLFLGPERGAGSSPVPGGENIYLSARIIVSEMAVSQVRKISFNEMF